MALGRRLPREDTAQRAAAITAAVIAGEPPRSVAMRVGVSKSTVYRCCRESGLLLSRSDVVGQRAAAAARREHARLMLRQGVRVPVVANRLGLSVDAVDKIRRGYRRPPPVAKPPRTPPQMSTFRERRGRRAQIAAAVVGGLTTEQAAARFGVSRSLVYYALSESGLELRGTFASRTLEQAIVQLAERGNPAATIARRLRVSEHRVRTTCAHGGVNLLTQRERLEAARLQARRHSLRGIDLAALLDGKHVKILKALRDSDRTLPQLADQFKLTTRAVFDIWTRALHRLAVPPGSGHDRFVAARKNVLSSGLSLNVLANGRHSKLLRRIRDSTVSMAELARNARISETKVWRLWYLALDRAAIAAARNGSPALQLSRKRRTKRGRRLLRDLVL